MALAQKNIEGYPTSLLFEVVSSTQDGDSKLEKVRMAELLETKEVQAAVTRSALEYSAKELNQSGQARYLFSDPGMCEFSWVSWLPWMGCEAPETKMSSSSLPLIMESSYSCY
ncbi:hypothetical protein J6590_040835 [Homalodisca vitripennis]|nr:hypothetical protein J6590_040835 [Homalodisca vitripennis]